MAKNGETVFTDLADCVLNKLAAVALEARQLKKSAAELEKTIKEIESKFSELAQEVWTDG